MQCVLEPEPTGLAHGLEVMGKGITDFSLNNSVVLFPGVGKNLGKELCFYLMRCLLHIQEKFSSRKQRDLDSDLGVNFGSYCRWYLKVWD